jgi:hypothetical protein
MLPAMSANQAPTGDAGDPVLRVVRGTPTPEELAALVGVVIARSRAVVANPPAASASTWTRSARPGAVGHSGIPARPGPDGWRASALPR